MSAPLPLLALGTEGKRSRGVADSPIDLDSSDDEAPASGIVVTVQLWDIALHPSQRNLSGYLTFRCTITRHGGRTITGIMGTNVSASSQDEWSFQVSSQAVSINMVPPTEPYLRKYLNSALKNGRYYVQNGQSVGLPHPPEVAALVTAMRAVGTMRARDGQPDPQLRPFLMQTLNLNARRVQRERGQYGDMALSALDWAFAPADAWRRVLDGEVHSVTLA